MTSIVSKIPKLFRRLAGKGCGAADFDPVYSRAERDAWRYAENPFEKKRFDLVVDALKGLTVGKALEVGCAEGHLTHRLAGRVNQLLACDIVDTAIERAREYCSELKNVQFVNLDVRSRWPDDLFDLLIYSDVLYYFSKAEIKRVIHDSAQHVREGGHLLFANEWHDHYRWKTPPAFVMEELGRSPFWTLVSRHHHRDVDSRRSIAIGLFQRRSPSES
jgi:2-polyprenyl-3-methyl-5-hydroxy-6-metoxy-1,4-benzoquinol methylase